MQANAAPQAKPGEFYSQDLELHFNYPVEMNAEDPNEVIERGHRAVYGVPSAGDPDHAAGMKCVRTLLDVILPEGNGPQRMADLGQIWVDDSKEYKESRRAEPISASIVLIEFMRECLPKKLLKNENDSLGSLAIELVSLPGIQRMPKPIWYEVGTQKVHMNSGAGRVIVNGHFASAPVLTMAITTEWRGHYLGWAFTSNDREVFNEITKSRTQFGDGPWGAMFPADFAPDGSVTGMTVLPK